jgi:hypothetical protein
MACQLLRDTGVGVGGLAHILGYSPGQRLYTVFQEHVGTVILRLEATGTVMNGGW